MFQSDQPIIKCADDRLDRVSFAESLAQSILSYKNKECIVLGLYGTWGTGKTSLINMCIECINKVTESYKTSEKPIIIKFNPWNYSQQEQLVIQFFNNLSLALRKPDHAKNAIKAGKQLITYAELLKPLTLIPKVGLIATLLEKIFKMIGVASYKWGRFRQKDIESQKNELSNLLENQPHKIIGVIDDIDRLNNWEIRQIFQLIKKLGDFPNIVYLVAFDKKVVIKALEKVQEGNGSEYLEKIIQVPFEIPAIPKEEIYRLLFSQLYILIKDIPEQRWDQTYWGNVFHSGIKIFFNTIRDVTRYINTLRFSFPRVQEEVNPIDFIAITSFQVFLPALYYEIRDNKDLFAGASSDFGRRNERVIEQEKKQGNEILNMVPENIKENVKELLTRLFPKLESIWGNANYGSDWLEPWRKNSRICSPDIFDTYFRLTIPRGGISQKEIETILSLGNNPNSFAEALQKLNIDGRITRFLERLEDYTRDYIPEKNIESIISVLMDIGDTFPEGDRGFFEIDTPMRILRICYQLTHRLDSHEKRFKVFKNAIEKATRSLFTIIHEVSMQGQQHEKYHTKETPTPEEKRTVNSEQLEILKKIVLNKIETWVEDGRLKTHKNLPSILFQWKEWGGREKVVNFVDNMVNNDEGLIDFITSFLTKSTSQSLGDYVYKTNWRISIKSVAEFIGIEKVTPRIRNIISSENFNSLGEKQKIALQTFIDIINGKIKDNF